MKKALGLLLAKRAQGRAYWRGQAWKARYRWREAALGEAAAEAWVAMVFEMHGAADYSQIVLFRAKEAAMYIAVRAYLAREAGKLY